MPTYLDILISIDTFSDPLSATNHDLYTIIYDGKAITNPIAFPGSPGYFGAVWRLGYVNTIDASLPDSPTTTTVVYSYAVNGTIVGSSDTLPTGAVSSGPALPFYWQFGDATGPTFAPYTTLYLSDPVTLQNFPTSNFNISQFGSTPIIPDYPTAPFTYYTHEWVLLNTQPLFTSGADSVNFNSLTPDQISAIAAGADLYHGLGGGDTVTLPDKASYTLGSSGKSWSVGTTFVAGDTVGQSYTIYGGDGNYNIQLGAGNDTVAIAGDGSSSLQAGKGVDKISFGSGSNSIELVGSSVVELFSALGDVSVDFSSVDGLLQCDELPGHQLRLIGFGLGDTIDFPNLVANECYFNPDTGHLTLYSAVYGQLINPVADIQLNGSFDQYSFALAEDSTGGTKIVLGHKPPSALDLAQMSAAVYKGQSAVGGFQKIQDIEINGFYAAAYAEFNSLNEPDQIVIAIRGTDLSSNLTALKNVVADAAFLSDPNFYLASYVLYASNFLNVIRNKYPEANITLTGHSLGGAIATLVADAGDYPVAAFDAPGARQLAASLESALASAASASSMLPDDEVLPFNSDLVAAISAYRLEGDQVSLVGQQEGLIATIFNNGFTNWLFALSNHKIENLIAALTAGQGVAVGTPLPDSALPGLITATLTTKVGNVIVEHFDSVNVVARILYYFDPVGSTQYSMESNSGSPLFSGIELPEYPGVARYGLQIQQGGGLLTYILKPGELFSGIEPFASFAFTPLDSLGNPVSLDAGLIIGVTFASDGVFNGQVAMVAEVTPPTFLSDPLSKATTETGPDIALTGQILFTDVNPSAVATASVTSTSVTATGSGLILTDAQKAAFADAFHFTDPATGAWSFDLAGKDAAFLAPGDAVAISATVTVDDGHGGTATQVETFTVNGSDEAPTIASGGGGASANYILATPFTRFITDVDATDPDRGDHLTYSIVGATKKTPFSIDPNTGVLSLTKGVGEKGSTITVKATDSYGASDTQTIKVMLDRGHMMLGTADSDTFVFAKHFGRETVKNFDPIHDTLQIDDTLTSGLDADAFFASSHVTQHGSSVWIDLDGPRHEHDRIVLNGILKSALSADDFHFI